MSLWDTRKTFEFIAAYQAEEVIWNPKMLDHKNKVQVQHAWLKIADVLQIPVSDLKKKREVLMTIFRKNLKTKKDFLANGKVYEPTWIYYNAMEVFLGDLYECSENKTSLANIQDITIPDDEWEVSTSYTSDSLLEIGNIALKSPNKTDETARMKQITEQNQSENNGVGSALDFELSKLRDEQTNLELFGKLVTRSYSI